MILIVDMNQRKNSLGFYEFVLPIVAVVKALCACTVKHYADINQQVLAQCDVVILSGTPLKDNATLNQFGRFEWIKTCDKPTLGVCAGFQTTGLVFGARLKRCLGIGMAEINTVRENCLFSDKFKAYTLHNYSVEPAEEFDVLAESAQCIQAIKLKERNVYGVLFHPEVRNPEILQRFVSAFSGYRRV